jgi:pilus assembly protein CpaC
VASFIDKLSVDDGAFEVIVGQSRILTIKEAMKVPAVVAVGDPSVLEFTILNARQIRLLGERLGTTDISLVTVDGRVYNLEVRVVFDLEPLLLQLRASFPEAGLKLSQLRDHVVVEGQARDATQVARIIETIKAYMASV